MDDRIKYLLSGYVDGELSPDEQVEFEQALKEHPELEREVQEFRKLKEVTGMVHYADLPDEVWDSYWESIYRKTERGIGWLFLSVGAIVLFLFGGYKFFESLLIDPAVPVWLKFGISAVTAGVIFLLVSLGRERLFAFKRDRYKEVRK